MMGAAVHRQALLHHICCGCSPRSAPKMHFMRRWQRFNGMHLRSSAANRIPGGMRAQQFCKPWHADAHMLCSAAGAWVVANGRRALNLVSPNFLGVAGDPVIMVRSQEVAAH